MESKLNELRKRIYQNLKRKAYSLEGSVSPELKTYRKDQVRSSKRPFSSSDIEELKESCNASDVIYLGDFHTFDQNIRNVLRILKVIANNERDCIIALEMVDAKHQYCLDAYMDGQLTELEFLESIDYHDSWRFPWTHYKLIFELAKEHRVRTLALNTRGNLKQRDQYAAEILDQALENNPNTQIVVVYGELHINSDKIPGILKRMNDEVEQTIIHQNLDDVYWTMKDEDQVEKIIKFNDKEFCINSAPPWVKYESMIYWYENLNNDPDFDIHEYIIENGKKIFSEDTHENFLAIGAELSKAAKLGLHEENLENFNLRDHTGLEFIEEKIQKVKDKTVANFYNSLIATGHSFRISGENVFYCSSYSMNRISYLAGIHVFHCIRQQSGFEDTRLKSKERISFFTQSVFESLHAFFFSKIMNPHRKCDMYWNLGFNLEEVQSKTEQKIYESALRVLNGESLNDSLFGMNMFDCHLSAQMVGHILGEYLYLKIFKESEKLELVKALSLVSFDEVTFNKARKKLLAGLDYKKHKKRYF